MTIFYDVGPTIAIVDVGASCIYAEISFAITSALIDHSEGLLGLHLWGYVRDLAAVIFCLCTAS